MSWIEYINSPQLERNADGFIHATRMFKVWDYSRSVILNHPFNVTNALNERLLLSNDLNLNYLEVPDPFGGMDNIILIAYDMRVSPNSLVSEVEIRYSNDIRLTSKPFGQDAYGRAPKGRAGAFQSGFESIPIMLRVPLSLDPITGSATSSGFEERQWPVPTQKNRISYSMLLNESFLRSYRSIVRDNLNKLVQFGTPQTGYEIYLFEGFDYSHHSPGILNATLFFLDDPGIISLETDSTADRKMPPNDKQWSLRPGINYVRPPFQQLQMVRGNAPLVPGGPPVPGQPIWQTLEWHEYSITGGISLLNIDTP